MALFLALTLRIRVSAKAHSRFTGEKIIFDVKELQLFMYSLSTRFIHPAWGFAMGWNYVLQWIVTLPLELTAAAITIQVCYRRP